MTELVERFRSAKTECDKEDYDLGDAGMIAASLTEDDGDAEIWLFEVAWFSFVDPSPAALRGFVEESLRLYEELRPQIQAA